MRRRLSPLLILCLAGAAHAAQGNLAADWQQFRKAYPYHIQTVALSAVHPDGHRTMIVSEPPPNVTFDGIRRLSPDFSAAFVEQHGIGVDGWVKDIVFDLSPLSEVVLANDIDRLHHALFGTNYKAYALSIPPSTNYKPLSNLDLHVNSADLASWLLPANSASLTEPRTTSISGVIVAALLLMWGTFRLLARKYISATFILLLATGGLIACSSSGLELILSGVFLLLAATLFWNRRTVGGSVLACLTLLFLIVGLPGFGSPDDAKIRFNPLLGGKEVTCNTILHNGLNGVYLSRPAGLVLWSLSRSKPIDSLPAQIREFALDTDMVVGAVSRDDQLVIVGRERTNDVSLLPPLRAETVLLLASANEDELKQSYERTVLMAGNADDRIFGEQDWAPILLSPRLIDSEYGSLLNITDQLLKSWSQAGRVRYVNFRYPDPASYPFEGGLMNHLGVRQVTFNWNTKGAGYVSKTGPYEIFALNRTAALPIDYLALGRKDVQKAEDDAYNWYAGLSDPNLIRVVHYAAIYQIFHHFGIHANVPQPNVTQPFGVLQQPSERFLRDVASYTDTQLTFMEAFTEPEFVDKVVRPTRDSLKVAENGRGPFTIEQIALVSCDRSKGVGILESASDADRAMLETLLSNLFQISNTLMSQGDKTKAMALYRQADTQHPGTWIRTASVVESATMGGTGGHNLGAKVTIFEADNSIDAGAVAVRESADGQKVIHYNPADEGRVTGSVRNAARNDAMSDSEIQETVTREMASIDPKVVEPAEGLGHLNGIRPDPLRGLQMSHVKGGYTSFGWRPGNMMIGDADAKVLAQLKGSSNQVMLLTRKDNGTYVIGMDGGQSIEAHDQASAIDGFFQLAAEAPDKRVHLHTKGLDERQTQGFLSGTSRYTQDYEVVATREEDIDMQSLQGIMADKYDLKNVVVHDAIVSEPDGNGLRMLSQDIEIKPKVTGRLQSIILQIRVFFEDLPGNLQAVTEHVSTQVRAYLEIFSEERDLRFAAAELTRRLQKEGVYVQVRAQIRKESRVAFYAYYVDPQRGTEGEGLAG
jgi:hypothetical protein